ncbi:kinase-like domain-containing protein [Melanogaster broomeanus]|nr:kinase-like domain-containing protein [Melanogaster broomeanus]
MDRRRELGIWRRLNHENVVPFLGIVYGFGQHGCLSLVSSWMPNGTLQEFLAAQGDRLTDARRLQLLLDIGNGLVYLHSLSIIQGDLSPNNVLLDKNYHARLTDFGHASLIGETPEALVYLKKSSMEQGTIRWAAPEQRTPDATSQRTTKSDIYSFGNIALQASSSAGNCGSTHILFCRYSLENLRGRKFEKRLLLFYPWPGAKILAGHNPVR